MADHFRGPDGRERDRALQALAQLTSLFVCNRFPPVVSAALAGARLVPIGKPDGGVRPIAVGELVRRLAGKMILCRYQGETIPRLLPTQLGVGVPGGAEFLIHRARDWVRFPMPGEGLLQLDFRNAFNCMDRTSMLAAIAQFCPQLLPYAIACYGCPASLYYTGGVIPSESGVHQGDPVGPLFFSALTHELTQLCCGPGILWSHWYLDDAYICGSAEVLHGIFALVHGRADGLGFVLNTGKCMFLHVGNPSVDLLQGIPRVPASTGCLKVLGSPVGGSEACRIWAQEKVFVPWQRALDSLACLADPQSATLILRHCLSGCKYPGSSGPHAPLWPRA